MWWSAKDFANRVKQLDESNDFARALILSHVQGDLVSLFEDHKTAKELLDALKSKYHVTSETHILLFLEKYNGTYMEEGADIVSHVNYMALLAKKLFILGHPMTDKM